MRCVWRSAHVLAHLSRPAEAGLQMTRELLLPVMRACGGPCDGVEYPLHRPVPPPLISLVAFVTDDPVPTYDEARYAFDRTVTPEGRTVHLYRHQPKPTRPATGAGVADTFPEEWVVGSNMPALELRR